MVRTAYRGLVAGALGLPLMLGAPSVALASDYDVQGNSSGSHSSDSRAKGDEAHFVWVEELKSWVKAYVDNREAEQEQSNETEQANANETTIYQISFGNKGDTAVNTSSEQENEVEAEQEQATDQSTHVKPGKGHHAQAAQESQAQPAQQSQATQESQESQATQESQSVLPAQGSQVQESQAQESQAQESQAQESQNVQQSEQASNAESVESSAMSPSTKVK